MTTDIAVRSTSHPATAESHELGELLHRIDDALVQVRTASVEEAKELLEDADALQALMKKRKMALDVIYPVAELKLLAERRIGEERLKVPRTYWIPRTHRVTFDWAEAKRLHEEGISFNEAARRLKVTQAAVQYAHSRGYVRAPIQTEKPDANRKDFDEALGINSTVASKWVALAAIPEVRLNDIIEELKADEQDLGVSRVLAKYRRSEYKEAVRVEPNLYRLKDGRYQVRLQNHGVRRHFTIPRRDGVTDEEDLLRARKTALRQTGRIKRPSTPKKNGLDVAYSYLRMSLQACDGVLGDLNPEARELAKAALSRGHDFEDALTKAMGADV